MHMKKFSANLLLMAVLLMLLAAPLVSIRFVKNDKPQGDVLSSVDYKGTVKDEAINILRKDVENKDKEIAQLKAEIAKLTKALETLQATITANTKK